MEASPTFSVVSSLFLILVVPQLITMIPPLLICAVLVFAIHQTPSHLPFLPDPMCLWRLLSRLSSSQGRNPSDGRCLLSILSRGLRRPGLHLGVVLWLLHLSGFVHQAEGEGNE